MSTKTVLAGALMLLLMAGGSVRSQGYAPATTAEAEISEPSPGKLSTWITYTPPDCCGPLGGSGPIAIELYARGGPSTPVAGGWLGDSLTTGFLVQGGGRSLFFNVPQTAAWTADFGITHLHHNGNRDDLFFVRDGVPLTLRTLDRTYASLALGREHWRGCANDGGTHLRLGWDMGIRYGSARLDVNAPVGATYRRFGSEAAAVFWGLQTVLEIPCGCCIWHVGARAELDDSWTDFDGFENKSIWDLSFLLSLGVRY